MCVAQDAARPTAQAEPQTQRHGEWQQIAPHTRHARDSPYAQCVEGEGEAKKRHCVQYEEPEKRLLTDDRGALPALEFSNFSSPVQRALQPRRFVISPAAVGCKRMLGSSHGLQF